MKKLFFCLLIIGLAGCSAGLKPMTRKELSSTKPPTKPHEVVTNLAPKEIIFIQPAKITKINTDIILTNSVGEQFTVPLEITIKQEPSTNYFKLESEKINQTTTPWGTFLLFYYATIAPALFALWVWYKKRKLAAPAK